MTDNELADHIEALLAKAMAGDWFLADGGVCSRQAQDGGNVVCLEPEHIMAASSAKWALNAALIVTLRNNAPAIITALRSDPDAR